LVTANPPYVGSAETEGLIASGWKEPALALDGGGDGLDLYRAFVPLAALRIARGGSLIVEVGAGQAGAVAALFEGAGFAGIETTRDYAGIERVVAGRKA
jgi:release factor glutamine methyltransferase